MPTTNFNIQGAVTGLTLGTQQININITTAVGFVDMVDLASGFNTLASPATAVGMIFVPPAGNTQTLTLKGVTGDTGVPLHLTRANVINFAAAGQDPAITAGAAVAGCQVIWF